MPLGVSHHRTGGSVALVPGTTITTTETPVTTTSKFGDCVVLVTATLINATGADLVGRKAVTIQNNSLNSVYVANVNTVSKTTGIYIAPGSATTLNIDPLVATPIYGISIGGISSTVSVLEV